MGRNGSRHGAQTKRDRKALSAPLPNFAAFLFSPSIRKSQRSQILSAFRHFPREEMPDIKLLERLAPPQTASEGSEGGREERRRDDGISKFCQSGLDCRASVREPKCSGHLWRFGRVFARTYAVPIVPFQAN